MHANNVTVRTGFKDVETSHLRSDVLAFRDQLVPQDVLHDRILQIFHPQRELIPEVSSVPLDTLNRNL